MLSVEDIADLGATLSRAGFRIATHQFLSTQRLLESMREHHSTQEHLVRLSSYLSPIFCTKPEEQTRFESIYFDWLAKRRSIQPARPFLLPAIPTPPIDLRYWWKWIGLGFLSIALLFGIWWGWNEWKPHQVVGTVLSGATPLDSVEVRFGDRTSTTGSDGRFSVSFRISQLPGSLTLEKNGFASASRPFGNELLASRKRFYSDLAAVSTQIDLGTIDLQKIPDTSEPAPSSLEPIILKESDGVVREARVEQVARVDLHDVIKIPPFWERIIWMNAALTITPLVMGLLWLLFRKHKQPVLQRMASSTPPALREVHLEQGTQHLFPSFQFRRLAQTMRSRRLVQSTELDTFRTIQATARRGGIFSPVYGAMKEPGYIALIDRMSVADHHARLALQMVADLLRADVLLDPLEFDRDPTLLRYVEYGRRPLKQGDTPIVAAETIQAVSLEALQAQYPTRRVLLFSEAATCFDRLSGTPEPWLETMAGWDERFLITAEPIEQWSKATWVLERKGFKVIPLSPLGFTLLTNLLQSGLYARTDRAGYSPFFQRTPEQWLERYEPKHGVVGRLCSELKQDLGHNGFLWLCACAAYPEIHWGLTLRLGVGLFKDQEQLESVLPKLSRLIWFREGFMPDWLRAALLKRLEPPALERVRTTLTNVLSSVAIGDLQTLSLQIAREEDSSNRWFWQKKPNLGELTREAPTSSPLRDYVFLALMSGRSLNDLSPVAPTAFMRAIFPEGRRAFGLQPWVMGVFFLLLTIGVAWVRTPIAPIFENPYTIIKAIASREGFVAVSDGFARVDAKLRGEQASGNSQVSFSSDPIRYRELYDAGFADSLTHIAFPQRSETDIALFATREGKVYLGEFEEIYRSTNGPIRGLAAFQDATQGKPLKNQPLTLAIADSTGIAFISYKNEQPSGPFRQIPIERPNAIDLRYSRAQDLLLAAGSKTEGTTLWTLADNPPREVFAHRSGSINTVTLSHDGSLLADGAEDGTVQIWSTLSAVKLATLQEGRSAIQDLAFTSEGDMLAAIDSEGTVRVWDTSSFKLLHTIQSDAGSHGKLAINTETFKESDSFYLLTVGEKSLVQVWQISRKPIASTGKSIALLIGNNYPKSRNEGLQGPIVDTQLLIPPLERLGYQVFQRTEVSHSQILKDFTSLIRQLNAADTLIVLLAGHGNVDKAGMFSFIGSYNGTFNEAHDSVTGDQIAEFFRTVPAQQALLLVDASFSRSLAKLSPHSADKAEQPKIRMILSSYTTDHPMDSPTGGPFAKALALTLHALTQSTSGASLAKDVARRMSLSEKNQTPSYEPFLAAGHTGGDFQFVMPKSPSPPIAQTTPSDTAPSPEAPQKLKANTLPQTGYAYYGSAMKLNFRQVGGGKQDDPVVGDVVEATVQVHARKGYIQLSPQAGWVNQDAIGLIKPGDQLKVIGVYRPVSVVIWIQYELVKQGARAEPGLSKSVMPPPTQVVPAGNENPLGQSAPLAPLSLQAR